jgi:hypothetical protein
LEAGEFVMAEIRGKHPQYPGWATPMKLYFRRIPDGWRLVGVDRM